MLLSVENISFAYGKHRVLSDLSFSLSEGEMLAVLGANGAGKSTLFRCILGLLKRYRGRISIDGTEISSFSAKRRSQLLAYIPQSHYPAFNYSVTDMVLMGTAPQLSTLAAPKKAQYERVQQALALLGIESLANRSYTRLSGGEQQLVLIARALVQDAKILLMDEPVANLDFGNQHLVLRTAEKLCKDGYSILLSTHNPQHALRYADNLLAIKDGTVRAWGSPYEVLTSELIRELYGVNATIERGAVLIDDSVE
ncbi:MAG: ABC transporter ATP-binding protein [Clostridia bacterium]|nr:ABC transporter ATP-binding protein [Clostridia bacterium]